ncbi:hypothetical protein OQH61_05155 [Helicobacter sp. MIT 21-1697]|uniref:hypothetical protein n=1 Tax=Helicobacter sp. MIT 21-1697 TaxID=2993733 RepID=UPI00224B520D|nr:hypothetical protein [Helicobacter sp. MIT 21-1697]MCX2717120.1 hypothetical protein [Helicobacter sp. MIT 21-1697]
MTDLDLQNKLEENAQKLNAAFEQNASLIAYIFAFFATFVPLLGTYIVRKDFAKESINKASGVALLQALLLFIFALIPFLGWFILIPIAGVIFAVLNILAVMKAYKSDSVKKSK